MRKKLSLLRLSTIFIIIFILSVGITVTSFSKVKPTPDFSSYTDINEKKTAFFDFMYSEVVEANKNVLITRSELLDIDKTLKQGTSPSSSQTKSLQSICTEYRADCGIDLKENVATLLRRVDIVPASLALAQAANESAWGSSRFAKKGNNYFGQWCYEKGCGIIPKQRNEGSTHEVRKFRDVSDSVAGYIYNLNTAEAYSAVRKNRAKHRLNNEPPSSLTMVKGLSLYSERGQDYIKELTKMITFNNLKAYDQKLWLALK